MIRKLLFPALAVALLGGCVSGYEYRSGYGDYYYGQPSVQYDDYGYGGYYGGYGGFGPYGYGDPWGFYGSYGYPYGGYGYPYPPYYPYRPSHRHDRDHDHDQHGDRDHDRDHDDDDQPGRPKPPWRDLGGLKPREPRPAVVPGRTPQLVPAPPIATGRVSDGRRATPVDDSARRTRDNTQERDVRRKRTP